MTAIQNASAEKFWIASSPQREIASQFCRESPRHDGAAVSGVRLRQPKHRALQAHLAVPPLANVALVLQPIGFDERLNASREYFAGNLEVERLALLDCETNDQCHLLPPRLHNRED